MSVGSPSPLAMKAEVTVGVVGKMYSPAEQGVSLDVADPALVSTPTYLRCFVRYAEVLIDVRAQTEIIVNSEQPYAKSVVISSNCIPRPVFKFVSSLPPITIDHDTRSRLIESLGSWHFEPHKLPENQVLACTYILFEALFRIRGMQEDVGVSLRKS